MTIRSSMLAPAESIPVSEALGRICASPLVSCPPAVPIVISGEVLDAQAIAALQYYGAERVRVVKG